MKHVLSYGGRTFKSEYCIECNQYMTKARCVNCKEVICARCRKNSCNLQPKTK